MDKMILIQGDCNIEMPKRLQQEGIKPNLVIADLPYGTTNCRWDTPIDLPMMWANLEAIVDDRTPMLFFAQTPFDKILGASNIKKMRYEWIWEKTQATGHLNAKKAPMKAHENILVFYKKAPLYQPIKTQGHKPVNSFTKTVKTGNNTEVYRETKQEVKGGGNTDRYPRSVLKGPSDKQRSKLHSTQKPIWILEYFIETYTKPGDIVLDITMGSGSTGEAALNKGRYFIGIEKDPDIFNTAKERINDVIRKQQLSRE